MSITGYSGTALVKKIGIKPEIRILLIREPDEYYSLLETNNSDQLCKKNVQGTPYEETPDFIHLFVKTEKEFIAAMKKLNPVYKKNRVITIWGSWYKKAAKNPTDVKEYTIRNYALQHELIDEKVCTVSEVWSGLKLVMPVNKRY